jgi:hypothetical protein
MIADCGPLGSLRDFRHLSDEIPQVAVWRLRTCEKPQLSWLWSRKQVGPPLAPTFSEHHVFQAAVLSLVLTLAVGQNAGLVCNLWCDPHQSSATGCHHQDSAESKSVTGGDHCNNVVIGFPAFLREDERPRGSAQYVQHALVGRRFQFIPFSSATHSDHDPGQDWWPELRPLVTALRI